MKCKCRGIMAFAMFVFIVSECYAQHITGKIADEQGNPIAYANIVLKTVSDSVLDGTISDDKGFFVFGKQYNLPLMVEVSFVGYTTWSEKIYELPIRQIILFLNEEKLDESVVIGKKQKIVTNKNGVLSVNVSKSFLKDERNIYSLLAKVPWVKAGNESIALFGKDHLAIYIDDRKVLFDGEYNMLNPSDILRIEVIRNPGAEYDAGADAVLKIYTNRNRFIQNTSFNLTANTSVSRGISNSISTSINHSGEFISQTFKYNYGRSSGIKQQDVNRTYNYLPTRTILDIRDVVSENSVIRHGIFYGLSLSPSKKTEFGIQYRGYFRNTKENGDGFLDIFSDELMTSHIRLTTKNRYKNPLNNFSVNLNHKITPKLKFTFVGDYAYVYHKTLNFVEENPENKGIRINENTSKNKYHIFSANPRFTYSVSILTLTSGIKVSYMKNMSNIWYGNSSSEKIWLTDFVGGIYAGSSKN